MGSPDEQIHPVATGAAAETAAQHQTPQDLIFYSGWFCPFVQRTWIVLEEKGIPYQYKEVNPYKKEKHFLDINPKGLVPAMEYQGKALYESLILCEFLEEAFPKYKPQILPSDPVDRAIVRIWVDHITKFFVPAYQRLLSAQEKEKQEGYLEELNQTLRKLTDHVKGPYFLGDEFSLVDVAIAPWVLRDYVISEHRGYTRIGVGAAWKAYAENLEKRPSVAKTMSQREYLADIYGRYLRDEAQSEAAKAIRAGRTIP
ncbi:glutathione-S-transferase [Pluteus cervinus]|uniref:Glutathione-S-transferase n=1 Tax=Pluteus cervinus TaxID=181527 RepID=A0ACD3BAA9_9AGAR|nr:glutathione-S-transferase [Pluteus cervinus]